ELRDGLRRPAYLRLLAGDRGQVADGAVDQLRVPGRLADTHVHHDLHQTGYLHRVGVTELLAQPGHYLVAVPLLEARQGLRRSGHHRSLPEPRSTRIFWPLSSMRQPIRVALPSVSTTIMLETWIAASWMTMPPGFAPRWVVRMRVCFLTRLMTSTRTLSSF